MSGITDVRLVSILVSHSQQESKYAYFLKYQTTDLNLLFTIQIVMWLSVAFVFVGSRPFDHF